jgi:hemolysin activation/secretion protein
VKTISRIALFISLVVGVMVPNIAFLQTRPDIDAAQRQAEIIQHQEQNRIQRDQEDARSLSDRVNGMDTKSLLPKIQAPNGSAICQNISTIAINEAPHLDESVRKKITDEFAGRCLNVGDIEKILTEITKYYIDNGFISARAYLSTQDLGKGRLDILVVEGVVNKLIIDDEGVGSVSIRNIFPGVEGKILNLRDLEQGIDQINRLSSNNAKLDIQPGESPGESTVVVHNQPKSRFHFGVSIDNQGQNSTGKTQTGITGGFENLLGLNDFFQSHTASQPPVIKVKNSLEVIV